MRISLTLSTLIASATYAFAHAGHFPSQGGHDHWVALAAFSAALVVAAAGFYAVHRKQR